MRKSTRVANVGAPTRQELLHRAMHTAKQGIVSSLRFPSILQHGIEVLDHLVLGEDGRFVSLRQRGAL